jgi:3-oxoacyl-[acyl-carrier protein] reductase
LSGPAQQAVEGMALSSSSQMAVMGYFKTLANELAPFNITVNNVISGPVDTELFMNRLDDQAEEQGELSEELLKRAISSVPIGRLGKPEEVGDLVAFLASERAGFVTGTSVVADGGRFQGVR